MDAALAGETTAQAQKQTTKEYKSPPHALIWFFRKSRDLWKSKCQELQASSQAAQEPRGRCHQEPRAVETQGRAGQQPTDRPRSRER